MQNSDPLAALLQLTSNGGLGGSSGGGDRDRGPRPGGNYDRRPPPMQPGERCRHFLKDRCTYGVDCKYVHSIEEYERVNGCPPSESMLTARRQEQPQRNYNRRDGTRDREWGSDRHERPRDDWRPRQNGNVGSGDGNSNNYNNNSNNNNTTGGGNSMAELGAALLALQQKSGTSSTAMASLLGLCNPGPPPAPPAFFPPPPQPLFPQMHHLQPPPLQPFPQAPAPAAPSSSGVSDAFALLASLAQQSSMSAAKTAAPTSSPAPPAKRPRLDRDGVGYIILQAGSHDDFEASVEHEAWGVDAAVALSVNSLLLQYRKVLALFQVRDSDSFSGYAKIIGSPRVRKPSEAALPASWEWIVPAVWQSVGCVQASDVHKDLADRQYRDGEVLSSDQGRAVCSSIDSISAVPQASAQNSAPPLPSSLEGVDITQLAYEDYLALMEKTKANASKEEAKREPGAADDLPPLVEVTERDEPSAPREQSPAKAAAAEQPPAEAAAAPAEDVADTPVNAGDAASTTATVATADCAAQPSDLAEPTPAVAVSPAPAANTPAADDAVEAASVTATVATGDIPRISDAQLRPEVVD